MHIDFHDKTKCVSADIVNLIQRLLLYAAEKEAVSQQAEMSINFVRNKEIQELNRNYRQQNKPTDVISFALQDHVEEDIHIINEDIPLSLGDIVISVDKAQEQAAAYGHSLQRELCFLAVHGFLHLLGYDHENKEDERVMFQKQKQLLDAFDIGR
ncbi:MAG TPA: rRNA maturation RNase YbeY [Bacillota bacterium]|nr:rRNA maturation RNase YbeY [Bacillota bacterium]